MWFLEGGGLCGALARSVDWSKTSLGPPEDWSPSLKSTVATLLHSRHPMFLWWGEDLIQIYNDAYVPSFGKGKHPAAMGQRGADCWQEIWPIIWPQIQDVMQRGKSSWHEDHLVPIHRNGRLEEVYWTYGYSPVFDEQGVVGGTLVVCTETTPRVLGNRRLRTLHTLAEGLNAATGTESLFDNVAAVLREARNDIPFALIYQTTAHGGAELATAIGLDDAARHRIDAELRPHLSILAKTSALQDEAQRVVAPAGEMPGTPWPEAATQVYVAPLMASRQEGLKGLILFGLSPRLPWDAAYRQYLDHLAERISQALARRHADLERERLLREVRAQQERLKNLFAQAPAFMCVVDGPDHVFSLANERYYELIGRRDIIGKSVREALPEIAGQGFVKLLDRVYRTGESHFGNGVPVQLARQSAQASEERFIDFVYQAARGADGSIVGIVVHGIDQTERHRATQAMKDADRRKDEFLAVLAHELRNPLAPIANYVQLLDHFAGDADAVRQAGTVMRRQVDQMVRLIDDLLDVSRISSGKIELRRGRIEIAAVVRQAVDAARPYYESRRRKLKITVPGEPITVNADSARLTQVIGNLLHNAAKFTDDGGHVWLSVESELDTAVIRVRDDGMGIGPAQLSSIFQMFMQADASLERTEGGLGIGLALVRSLVELHGGTAQASSEGIGKGSEFVVRLPLCIEEPTQRSTEGKASKPRTPGARVLIVDDNRDACDSMAQLLRTGGHDALTAYDGLEGVAEAQKHQPDVILLDLGMPKLNGYDACRRIREQPWSSDAVLIALTGWGQVEDKRRTEEAGFDAHLVKPVDLAVLEHLLASRLTAAGISGAAVKLNGQTS